MGNFMQQKMICKRPLAVLIFLCILIVTLDGCATMRRKFVRKKKKGKEDTTEVILRHIDNFEK